MIQLAERKISTFPRFFMILSVPLVLFIMLFLGYVNLIPLKVEVHSIIILFLILLIFMFFISHNAWYSFATFRNSLGDIIKTIDEYLLSNELEISGRKKSYGNIDAFFDHYIKNIRNDNFANIAASIFPTLGILGTFTAIAISMPNFTVDSKEALESEITILLSGVGTAFYASIYGIFLSIWWTFFEKRGLTKVQNETDEIKLQYKEFIWTKDEIDFLNLVESKSRNEEFLNKVESIITPEFVFKLDEIAKAKLELVERLDEEVRVSEQRLTKNYATITQLFEDTSSKQTNVIESFESLNKKILDTNSLFSESIDIQNSHTKAIKTEIYSVLSSFELVSSDLKGLGKKLIEKDIEESAKDEQR
jgi:hypothetical protein